MKSSTRDIRWSVGELAARFELETHVLRHWEDKGLLHPERDSAGRRVYGEDDAYRVAAILASKASGMSLDQIRTLVDAYQSATAVPLTAEEVTSLPLAVARQPAWSLAVWVRELDDDAALDHARSTALELPVAQAVLRELEQWQDALT